jgi:hypothetical protein
MAWMENGDVENRSFEMQGVSAQGCNMHLVGVLEEDDVSQSPLTQQTVANFGDHQDSSPLVDFGCLELLDSKTIVWLFTPTYASSCPIEVQSFRTLITKSVDVGSHMCVASSCPQSPLGRQHVMSSKSGEVGQAFPAVYLIAISFLNLSGWRR